MPSSLILFLVFGGAVACAWKLSSLQKKLFPQATWRLRKSAPDATVIDVLAVLSRFKKREDFYAGRGYSRPEEGLLTSELFYERIRDSKLKRLPKSTDGTHFGLSDKKDIDELRKHLESIIPSQVPFYDLKCELFLRWTVDEFLGSLGRNVHIFR